MDAAVLVVGHGGVGYTVKLLLRQPVVTIVFVVFGANRAGAARELAVVVVDAGRNLAERVGVFDCTTEEVVFNRDGTTVVTRACDEWIAADRVVIGDCAAVFVICIGYGSRCDATASIVAGTCPRIGVVARRYDISRHVVDSLRNATGWIDLTFRLATLWNCLTVGRAGATWVDRIAAFVTVRRTVDRDAIRLSVLLVGCYCAARQCLAGLTEETGTRCFVSGLRHVVEAARIKCRARYGAVGRIAILCRTSDIAELIVVGGS